MPGSRVDSGLRLQCANSGESATTCRTGLKRSLAAAPGRPRYGRNVPTSVIQGSGRERVKPIASELSAATLSRGDTGYRWIQFAYFVSAVDHSRGIGRGRVRPADRIPDFDAVMLERPHVSWLPPSILHAVAMMLDATGGATHTRAVLSADAVTTCVPSGLNGRSSPLQANCRRASASR